MKRIIPFALVCLIAFHDTKAQNVGIGNTSPLARLDIDGDIAVRSADITIATTYNYAVNVNTVKQSSYKLKAAPALGNFIIAGITSGVDGRVVIGGTSKISHTILFKNTGQDYKTATLFEKFNVPTKLISRISRRSL